MNADELNSLILSGQPHLLIDVLPEDVHAGRHISGSANVCVYEMTFLDKVGELAPQKDTFIVVYGAGGGSQDSKAALGKLKAAGYMNVMELSPGLSGWQAAGFPVRGHGNLPQEPVPHGDFHIDSAESIIRWTGRNLFNHHSGTVKLSSGSIVLAEGKLISAEFTIDLNSIACEDITDSGVNAMLIRHLRDADFFEVEKHPTATFQATEVLPIEVCTPGSPNYLLRGNFTLRGVSKPLEFPVVIATADGKRLTGQGQLELDRTEFGSIYGSGRFFKFLGKHVVNDLIHLHVKIHADCAAQD
jgi:polyisoprenoid-binding protein YceI